MTSLDAGPDGLRNLARLAPTLAFAVLLYCAYFLLSYDFGLLSDDVFVFRRIQGFDAVWYDIVNGYSWNPRVLGLTLHRLLTYIGQATSTGYVLYLLCWIMLCAQAVLVFAGLKHYFSIQVAFLATCFFLLFPADASKYMPVHAFWTQFSAVGFWAAFFLFTREKYWLAALSVASTVFVYETHLLVGAALPLLPLLTKNWDMEQFATRLVRFWSWLFFFLLCAFFIRTFMAPGRLSGLMELSVRDLAQRLVDAVVAGVGASSGSLLSRPIEVWNNLDASSGILIVAIMLLLLLTLKVCYSLKVVGVDRSFYNNLFWYGSLLLFGAVAYSSSYLIYVSERFPPIWTESRLSNVHMAAGVGGTILVAAVLQVLLDLTSRLHGLIHMVLLVLVTAYLGLVSAYFYQYQSRLVDNWAYQMDFWNKFDELVPDLAENTLVLVEGTIAENQKFEDPALSWAFNFSLPLMRTLPADWDEPPLVIKDYTAVYTELDGELYVSAHTVSRMRVEKVVVLFFGQSGLERKQGSIELDGFRFELIAPPLAECCRKRGPLLDFLE